MAPGRAVKRRRVSPTDNGDSAGPVSNGNSTENFYNRAAQWDLEQDYERRPRKGNKKDKERTRLPIKTAEGTVELIQEPEEEDNGSDSFLDTDSEADEQDENMLEEVEEEKQPEVPLKVQIIQAKEELARLATLINEDPEEHAGSFKKLNAIVTSSPNATIKKLALATQAAVYRDVIPGYRIRPLQDGDMSSKVSKEVRKVRAYEQALLSGYHEFIKQLTTLAKSPRDKSGKGETDGLKSVAITCACNLLTSVPHFNFRGDLLKILINQLSKRQVTPDFVKCRETMEEMFAKDDSGAVSFQAVGILAKMMKARDFRVHESVLNTFLHLRLLSEFSSKGSRDKIDKPEDELPHGKKPKQKREFRTKKQRKIEKERKVVAKDMKEADALVSHEEREKMQSETLKLVFSTYFRILKTRNGNLMGAVLEGLAKYAHLINQDFFGDLLEALKDLISQTETDEADSDNDSDQEDDNPTRNSTRETLLCAITAFALLEGQDASKAAASLHLDLSFFIKHLYRALYPLSLNPDIEYNPNKSLRLPDPNSNLDNTAAADPKPKNKVNFQTPTVLLIRCLHSSLLPRNHAAAPPPIRLAGFTKRLLTSSLQLPEKSSLAILSLLTQIAKKHGKKIAPLWNTDERKGDGVFNPLAVDAEGSNVFAGNVWEGELLRLHYCPQVREAALDVEKMIANVS
ncbi:Nucleolar complex protein 3 [Arachnomyces sp. PD_36]|nr:Nucleolar complex protein 3 [Arachnomyces sp. PD_36]